MNQERIYEPNTTQVPNILFDYWMQHLKDVEFKVLLFITRKTLGWHKRRDKIAISQICDGVGFAETAVKTALAHLIKIHLVKRVMNKNRCGDNAPNSYELNMLEINQASKKDGGGGSSSRPRGVAPTTQGGRAADPTKTNSESKPTLPKGKDLGESKPFASAKKDKEMPKREHIKPAQATFPLKADQLPILEALQSLNLECDDQTLYVLIRTDYKRNPTLFMDCIVHLRNEISKGTVFKKGRIAFFRHSLKGKQSLVTNIAKDNKQLATDFAQANNWLHVKITDKYVLCERTQKEIPTNISPDQFLSNLMNLYDLSQNYN